MVIQIGIIKLSHKSHFHNERRTREKTANGQNKHSDICFFTIEGRHVQAFYSVKCLLRGVPMKTTKLLEEEGNASDTSAASN